MNRIKWIDALRAFSVFLIVLGHSLRGSSIYYFLYSFHVPLCVFVCGYCFKPLNSFNEFIKKITLRILVPYFVWGVFSIIIYLLASSFIGENISSIGSYVLGLIYGNGHLGMDVSSGFMRYNLPLWFLPCLFVVELLFWFICKLNEKTKKNSIVTTSIFVIIISYILSKIKFDLPFGTETAICLMPFFFWGYIAKQTDIQRKITVKAIPISIITLSIGYFIQKINSNVDYVADTYGDNYLLFLIAATMFVVGFAIIFKLIPEKICGKLSYFGQHTMEVLVLHKFPIMFFTLILIPRVSIFSKLPSLLEGFIIALISIIICLFAGRLVNMIAPFLLGNKSTSKKT